MKVVQFASDKLVGNLPMETSRFTKFLPDRGAEVSVTITGTYYRQSSLVQGGLEIPCNFTASLLGYYASKHVLLQRYFEIVSDLYVEPTNEEIIGSFLITNAKDLVALNEQILSSQNLVKRKAF